MTAFIVHGFIGSPFVRSVLVTLEEKGADYRLLPMAPGSHHTPEYRQRHAFERVPCIDHGDFHLYETQAIIRYVDRVEGGPSLVPSDPQRAARMDQLMGISDWYVFQQAAAPIGFNRVVAPMLGIPVNEEAVAAAVPKAQVAVTEVERLLDNQSYMTGDSLTLADIMLAPALDFLAQTPEGAEIMHGRVALLDWLGRMEARASMKGSTFPALMGRYQPAA